jgi:hypothetical protein
VREVRDILLWGRKDIILLEGSQASTPRSSHKDNMEVKAIGWLEAVPSDRQRA